MADRRAGLVVDQLRGQQEIVVKPIDGARGAASCFSGATILGDGVPALILEATSLLAGNAMNELLSLKPMQMDALREVANIGAGHAATALSQMTSQRIMISVPRISVTPLEDVPPHIGMPEEPVAAVLMNMLGDLTGGRCSSSRARPPCASPR